MTVMIIVAGKIWMQRSDIAEIVIVMGELHISTEYGSKHTVMVELIDALVVTVLPEE